MTLSPEATSPRGKPFRAAFVAVALTVTVFRLESYPADFLLRLERGVWVAQLFAWVEAVVIGAFAGALVLAVLLVLRELTTRIFPVGSLSGGFAKWPGNLQRPLLIPGVLGLGTSLATVWVWRSLDPIPRLPDGAAYLLQARIFLSGRWTAPPAPIPEFFAQMFVFVSPFTAAKYFPGFSLALLPGVAVGLPALVPVILAGAAGSLVFILTHRAVGAPAAVGAWLLWTTHVARYGNPDAYTAELLTAFLFLWAWWLIGKWDADRRPVWLVLLSIAFAAGALTRPMTMLAIFVPAAIHLARKARGRGAFRNFALAVLAAVPVLAILPVWSYETLGTVRTTPLQRYIAEFMPFDRPFAKSQDLPSTLPDEIRRNFERHARDASRNRFSDAPIETISRRLEIVLGDAFFGWRRFLVSLAVAGALSYGRRLAFGFAAALCVFTFYLTYAYPITHTGYYSYEVQPVFMMAVAAGLETVLTAISGSDCVPGGGNVRKGAVGILLLASFAVPCARDLGQRRLDQERYTEARRALRLALLRLPVRRAVVFMTFPRDQSQLGCPVENGPFLDREPIWLVRDLGTRDSELLEIAGGRSAYSYDVKTRVLHPLL
jgi:hypothetical protein